MTDTEQLDEVIPAGKRPPFVQTGMVVSSDDDPAQPIPVEWLVSELHDDGDEAHEVQAVLLAKDGERITVPCPEIRANWRLALSFDQAAVYTGKWRGWAAEVEKDA